jgi:hydroxypyruvate isomerase
VTNQRKGNADKRSQRVEALRGESRRHAIGKMGSMLALGALGASDVAHAETSDAVLEVASAGRIKQSVCQWCYDKIPLDDLCKAAKKLGLQSVELLGEKDWATVKAHGLTCAMANGPSTIRVGFNKPSEHDRLVAESERLLPLVAAAGLPNMIVFSGNRDGMADGEGLENCVKGLQRITPTAEKLGVTVCMELLNSKVDHKDYMCDRTPWGAELVKRVGSPRFKLLYDIYHMQIMEGDVIRTIRDNIAHIGHFHTGGVPGFTGYVAQEFIPSRNDAIASLAQGVKICDV